MDETRYHTIPSRPVPPAGRERKFAGRDGDGTLRNFAVFPPLDNCEFFKYSQVLRGIFLSDSIFYFL